MFEPATGFAGSTVRVAEVGEDTVDRDNRFRIEPVEPGEHVLTVTGEGHLNRQVRIQMKTGGANEIPALTLAEDGNFNLGAFDEIYRDDGERGTARMVRQPRFRIDRSDFRDLPGSAGGRLMTDIENTIRGEMARAIAPFLAGVEVTREDRLPNYVTPCEVPAYEVHIWAESDLRNDEGYQLLGWAWWCWWPDRSEVRGGLMSFDDSARTDTILHELVHLLGAAGHLESTPWRSIIGAPDNASFLTPMDELHLRFLYERPPGILSPDDGRNVLMSDLTHMAGGSQMEQRCLVFADGSVRLEVGYPGELRMVGSRGQPSP
jgi:hypothetical protein